jgi:hypothetical protein
MDETEILRQELEHYRNEKERIRKILGQIGGKTAKRRDQFINILFLVLVFGLFTFDILREKFQLDLINIPSILSIELAVLLVSLKIIFMISRQSKVEHFQFWILNSIEFQLNLLSKKVREIDEKLK